MPSSARWLALLSCLLALGAGTAHAQCGPRFVATGGSNASTCLNSTEPCATIQHGVDVACSGDTVSVGAGTYTEQVTIGTSLTLTGAGAATTTIKVPPPPLTGMNDIVTIQAGATVELSGFTVSGPGNPIGTGIRVLAGGSANIHDNTIANVRHDPIDGAPEGYGIQVGNGGFGGAAMATIASNTVFGYQLGGMLVLGSTATITGNTVTGVGPTPTRDQVGIEVEAGSVTVSGNTVTGNMCTNSISCGPDPVTQGQGFGLRLDPSDTDITAMANSIAGNDVGIFTSPGDPNPPFAGAIILRGNTITDNRYAGILFDLSDGGAGTIDANKIDSGNVGIEFIAFAGLPAGKGTLTCNQISGATQAGIFLRGEATTAVATATNNSVTGNVVGVDNTIATGPPVDARQNWWGCVLGPGNTGCDPVSGNVDASSPLAAPPPCASPPTTTSTTTIIITTTTVTTTTTTTTISSQCRSNASCGDGNVCNGVETCQAGVCIAGTPLNCSSGDPCIVDNCDPRSGCQHTTVSDLGSCSIVIPGGRNRKSDCYVFADVAGEHPVRNRRRLACADGDPSCDLDRRCNNVCALKVRLCINSATLPPCTPPSQLATLRFKSRPAKFTLNTPAGRAGAQCGAFKDIDLPVKVGRKGRKSPGVLMVTARARAPEGKKPRIDSGTYVITCVPGCAP